SRRQAAAGTGLVDLQQSAERDPFDLPVQGGRRAIQGLRVRPAHHGSALGSGSQRHAAHAAAAALFHAARSRHRRRDTRRAPLMADRIAALRALCGGPRDGALLRLSLAQALLDEGAAPDAIAELRRALEFDADYSAAWKALGRALAAQDDSAGAIDAY